MKTRITLLLAIVAISSTGYCHIGETPEECTARYGEALQKQQDDYGNTVLMFRKGGFDIFLTFLNGKAQKAQYGHSEKNALGFGSEISDNEAELILKANAQSEWKKVNAISMSNHWETADGLMFAEKRSMKPLLFICTKEMAESIAAAQKAKEKQSLQGL